MIELRTPGELDAMRAAGAVVADMLTAEVLDAALERCLSGELAERVRAAGERGRAGNARARAWFEEQLAG